MPQAVLTYWCLLLICSIMSSSSSAFYVPQHSKRVSSLQHIARHLERDEHQQERLVKRAAYRSFGALSRMISKHRRYSREQAVIQRMFDTFDMNGDNVIEQDEFKATLKLLGIVRHRY